jgi:hypothetical protein
MRIARHVVARKDQQLVALPAQVRQHLGLVPGEMVWWHIGRKGHVALSVSGRVRGGRLSADVDCSTCPKLRAELDRLRRELRAGEVGTSGQFFRAGYHRALGDLGNFKADLQLALMLLKTLVGRDRGGVALRSPRGPRARRRTEVVPGPDSLPLSGAPSSPSAQVPEEGASPARHTPDPLPSSVVSEGEASTPGPSVPGGP